MSLAFPNLSWWLWSGKRKEPKLQHGSSLNSSAEFNVLELDVLKFPSSNGDKKASTSRRVRRKWGTQEGKIDREYDVVLVPSDGGCFSDCESDDSDWSIGWSEPHAPGFLSEDEIEGGFGVLVPCYGRGVKHESKKNMLNNIANVPELFSAGVWRLWDNKAVVCRGLASSIDIVMYRVTSSESSLILIKEMIKLSAT